MSLVYDSIPIIAIGIILLIVGLRLNGSGITSLARLGLVISGLIVLPLGIFTGWAELTAGFGL